MDLTAFTPVTRSHAAAPTPTSAPAPSLRLQLLNFAVFQAAWTAAVLGAAGGWPLLGDRKSVV